MSNVASKDDDIVQCKVCQQLKRRIVNGKRPNLSSKKYVDPFGKEWNGKTCPTCHREKQKAHMKKRRSKEVTTEKIND
jgi:ssDNA-binding Zn-finger/Zn-ribbon topoisomerase 1